MNERNVAARQKFMRDLHRWDGVATSQDIGPQTTQAENSARQYCRRKGWVTFEGGYWRITPAGYTEFSWTPAS
jgi:hypothetical protein